MRGLALLALILPFAATAADPAQEALQQFVRGVDTLTARFEQVQRDDRGKVLQTSTGRVSLARPGKFRWAYEKPYEQLMVCDGKTLWQFDPDLAQVMVRPAGSTLQGTPAQLLSDRTALEKHFTVENGGVENGQQRVRLVPKAKDSDFKSVVLWLQDGAPRRMRFEDPLGGASEVAFTEVRTNGKLDAGQFTFTVPKGVEVIQADDRPRR
jgi:outer membrane lipoprotein carrier protein